MRYYSILVLIVLLGCGQTETVRENESYGNKPNRDDSLIMTLKDKCKEDVHCYESEAIRDFQNGDVILFYQGLMMDGSFMDYYSGCLEMSTDINVVCAGDVGDSIIRYYNDVMVKLIIEKYGKGYFDSCRINSEKSSGKQAYLKDNFWQR